MPGSVTWLWVGKGPMPGHDDMLMDATHTVVAATAALQVGAAE